MKVAIFSTKPYDREFLEKENKQDHHELTFFEPHLNQTTASLAQGFEAVCLFVNDEGSAPVLEALAKGGTSVLALRCSGFNHVDLDVAEKLGIRVVRVPAYSPHAVAEHAVGLMLTLNRQLYRAHHRIREGNFSLDGLLGFDFYKKKVGIVGTGKIGRVLATIMQGFGCKIFAFDPIPHPECLAAGVPYVSLEELWRTCDVISLHCPLTPDTYHLINAPSIEQMRQGVMLINTSRGALIDTQALIAGLKSRKIGYVGLDVYEEEADLFFEDLSDSIIQDDIFARLLTFPNVIITGHQAFFTKNALENIAATTLSNLSDLEAHRDCPHVVSSASAKK